MPLAWLALLVAAVNPAAAASRRVVIAVMNATSWADLAEAEVPTLQCLAQEGSVALLARVSGNPMSEVGAYATLGAGGQIRARGLGKVTFVEPARVLDTHHPGYRFTSLRLAEMERLRRLNEGHHEALQPGLLGTLLRQANLSVGVVVAAGAPLGRQLPEWNQLISLLAMDTEGYVPLAAIATLGPGVSLQSCLRAPESLVAALR